MDKRATYQQTAQSLKSGGGDFPPIAFWYPQVGKNIIRILPPKDFRSNPDAVFFQRVFFHWKVGPDNRRLICRKSADRPGQPSNRCPVCEMSEQLITSGRKDDVQLGKDMGASEKFVLCVIDVNAPDKGVQIFESPKNLFNDILQLFLDEDYGDLDSLERGRHVKIERTGTGKFDTRYTVIPTPTATAIAEAWMERVIDLAAFYQIPTPEYMQAVLEGRKPEEAATTLAAATAPAATPTLLQAAAAALGSSRTADPLASPPPPLTSIAAPTAVPRDLNIDLPPGSSTAQPPVSRAEQMRQLREGLAPK